MCVCIYIYNLTPTKQQLIVPSSLCTENLTIDTISETWNVFLLCNFNWTNVPRHYLAIQILTEFPTVSAHDNLDTSVSLVPCKEESKRVTKDRQGKRPFTGASSTKTKIQEQLNMPGRRDLASDLWGRCRRLSKGQVKWCFLKWGPRVTGK